MLTFFMNRPIDFAAQNTLSFGKIILRCPAPWRGTLEQLIWEKELIRSMEGYNSAFNKGACYISTADLLLLPVLLSTHCLINSVYFSRFLFTPNVYSNLLIMFT